MKIVVTHPNMTSINDSDQARVPINDLAAVENSSCLAVHLADCMDFIPFEQRIQLLSDAYGKVRKGGEITISGTELEAIGHYIVHNITSSDQINVSLFNGRLSCEKMWIVSDQLESIGAKLINSKLDGLYYSIKARRPDDRTE
jgi:hypothetical protein